MLLSLDGAVVFFFLFGGPLYIIIIKDMHYFLVSMRELIHNFSYKVLEIA